MDEMVGGNELAFPLGLHGRKEHALRTPVVRLMLPAGHPLVEPPFPLPGRACWEILREGAFPHAKEAKDNCYTFILWDEAPPYRQWIAALLGRGTSRPDVTVILHAAGAEVPHHLAGVSILKADHEGRLCETMFRLLSAMVLPAVFQSIIGADPVDIASLSGDGGSLHANFAEADDVEEVWTDMKRCWENCPISQGRLTGLVFAIMAPVGMPVLTSPGLLDGDRWERLLGDINIDIHFMVTLFGRKDEKVSATLLRIIR
ncbi:MAG: hypothetical protein E6Q74_03635 [Pseudoxanthomonas sp.]|nr:MAG: hypothetical protein E6Q74_03635 [Pseudoxanthomonas sp.]